MTPSVSNESAEPTVIYTYHRFNVALHTPSLDIAFQRNDGQYPVTFVKYE